MFQTTPSLRYVRALRRARLTRLAAAGAVVLLPAACGGTDDADVFGAADAAQTTAAELTSDTSADTTLDTSTDPVTTDTDATTTSSTNSSSTSSSAADTTSPAESASTGGDEIATVNEVVVEFTYAASGGSGGRIRNPYIAVWVEDTDGDLIQTISVWYESGKGEQWLDDLRAWYGAASGTDVLTSGATRSPGTYSVVWDGSDLDGGTVGAGEYVLFVESAREHGPYSITSAPITVGAGAATVTLPDDVELSGLTATMSA